MDQKFELDMKLLSLGKFYQWELRDAVQGVQIFGGIGSGKTSGSGRTLATRYLKEGFGGLVLSVKQDEIDIWKEYCRESGRLDDLIVVKPEGNWQFNFLDYEASRTSSGGGYTENLVMILKTAINAGQMGNGTAVNNEPFWENALDMLLFNIIDLCRLAYNNRIHMSELMSLVYAIPNTMDDMQQSGFFENNNFGRAMKEIKKKRDAGTIRKEDFELYKRVEDYFLNDFIPLHGKTKSSIIHSISGLLFRLYRDPIYSLFCSGDSNFSPESSLDGKIIFLDLPVKQFDKVGREIQIIFKYIWQRAMERRNIRKNNRPVFLWADEAQFFLHEHDIDYQATARSKRICTVYLTQNLPNYLAQLGGDAGRHRVMSFLGTLGTKIFHANVDKETNEYAANLIGKDFKEVKSSSKQVGKGGASQSTGTNYIIDYIVPPETFALLKTGGTKNKGRIDTIMHMQDPPWQVDRKMYYDAIFYQ